MHKERLEDYEGYKHAHSTISPIAWMKYKKIHEGGRGYGKPMEGVVVWTKNNSCTTIGWYRYSLGVLLNKHLPWYYYCHMSTKHVVGSYR